jgi:hypothetical protein
MPPLAAFSTPGNVKDKHRDAWSQTVADLWDEHGSGFKQFFDPLTADLSKAAVEKVVWPAFPLSLRAKPGKLFETADRFRVLPDGSGHDEYCEWGIERNRAGKLTRVTFTTEVPEYYEHLFKTDKQALLDLYHRHVSPKVKPDDLGKKVYKPRNIWNKPEGTARPAHLIQGSNNLGAAIALVAQATIQRELNGRPVTTKQELITCNGLGNPRRSSDPQIAVIVNDAAAGGAEISLSDPPGLYLEGLITGGMKTPDGTDPGKFWKAERGDRGHVVRAAYEVPKGKGHDYVVGDITIGGEPIKFGGQIAKRVRIRVEALVKPGTHKPKRQPCIKG